MPFPAPARRAPSSLRSVSDLTAAPFVDSAALGLLVGLYRRIQPGSRVWVSVAASLVAKVFDLTGLSWLFLLICTPKEAMEQAGQ
jgi:anti-anti-sigma factor